MEKKVHWGIGVLVGLLLPAAANAQTPRAAGTFEEQAAIRAATENDETRLRVQVGGSFAGGNTRSVLVNGAARFSLRRNIHQFTADLAANYGLAWNLPGTPAMLPMCPGMVVMGVCPGISDALLRPQTTAAENILFRARYDVYFLGNNSFYFSGLFFRDVPGGFNARVSGQLGYLRNFINTPTQRRFWGEVGFDATYENTTQPATGSMTNDRFMPFARLFLGFEEKSSRYLELNAGIEGLLDLTRITNLRMNATLGIGSKITDDFTIGLNGTLRFVNEPVPFASMPYLVSRDPVDVTALVTLTYQANLQPRPAPAPAAPPPPPPPPPPATTEPAPAPAATPAPTPAAAPAPAPAAAPAPATPAPATTAPAPAPATTAPR